MKTERNSYGTSESAHQSGTHAAFCDDWVLVLDDDVTAARSFARWVKRMTGLEVRIACTIRQAQCWVASMPEPSAILSDFELQSGENGIIALQEIRNQGCRAPAAIITGAAELALCSVAESALDEVIPVFSRSELHVHLRDWLEQLHLCWPVSDRASA